MKTAIILHGMPSKEEYLNNPDRPSPSNSHWLPWLQQQLIVRGILAQTPELPEPYAPDYGKWRAVLERFPIDEETILVGHSCGGGFLVRWLSEHGVRVGKVALIAPWINPKDSRLVFGLFAFVIDSDLAARAVEIRLFISADDDKEELDTAELLKKSVKGITVAEFTDRGHFTYGDMGTDRFPELSEYLLA